MNRKLKNQTEINDSKMNQMSVIGHLEELRKRIIYILIALILGSILAFFFIKDIILFLKEPISNLKIKLYYFKPYEKLTTYFKIALFSSLVCLMPFIIYQINLFILPALYKKEKKVYLGFTLLILTLFFIGAYFCYKMIAPVSFQFFTSFMEGDEVLPLWGIKDYFSLLMLLVFFTGIIFQLPLIMFILAKIGLVTGEKLSKYRRHAILIIFIVAAIVTPPDVVSQILLAIPTVVLYEISIFIAKIVSKKKQKKDIENNDGDETNLSQKFETNPYNNTKL